MKYFIVIPFLSIFCLEVLSQSTEFFADAMINADHPTHRTYAAGQFERMFADDLAEASSFSRSFADLPWISIQYPIDSSFRIITWQIDQGSGRYAYNGYVQTSDHQVFKIGGPKGRSSHDNNEEIALEKWKGGLVYKILDMPEMPGKYFLLTYRILNQFTKVKTLEPLRFEDDGVVLGQKGLFEIQNDSRALNARLALLYSIDANASITYDEESRRFVFDNLIMIQGRIPGQGTTAVPDGSYKAYEMNDEGSWTYIDKLYTEWNDGPLNPEAKNKLNNELFIKKIKN